MTFVPRVAALDVDGTLVDETNALSPAVRDAVLALADAGVAIVVATGRAMPGTMEVVDRIGLQDGTAVTSNGAIVIGYHPVEVLHSVTFDASEAVRRSATELPVQGGPLLLDAAFLVPRTRADRFRRIVARRAKDLAADGYRVTLTGPWPPYSFVRD